MKKIFIFLVSGVLGISSCLTPESKNLSSTTGTTATSTITRPSGAMAAKIIFRQSNPSGSFSAPPSGGTMTHAAERVFNADGSLLADGGPTASSWPKWLASVAIGISGTNNTAATNPACARFASGTESSSKCDYNRDGTFDSNCGAPSGQFRVSLYDCVSSGTFSDGNGGQNDGVYIRVNLDRNTSYLASFENLLLVLEYASGNLNAAPADPTLCLTNGLFDPTNTNCSDQSWQVFLKHSAAEVVQPFFTLIPPAFGYVDTANNRSGAGVASTQIHVPIASDSELDEIQISRIKSLSVGAPNLAATCKNPAQSEANSPLCFGVVLYSLTIYRVF